MNEPMHRFKYTKLTKEQIAQKLAGTAGVPTCASGLSEALYGKSLKIVTDNGPVLNYRFLIGKSRLTFAEGTESPVESGYGALPLSQLVLFSHMVPKTQKGYNVVVDLKTNLATVFEVWFCGGKEGNTVLDDREVQRQIYYGYVEIPGTEAPKARHHLTNRLEGKGFHWTQDNGVEVLDFYPSIISSSFVELTRQVDDLGYCAPSDFVIINDQQFIYDRTECEFSGIHTMYAMDLYSMKQVGVRLGFNEKDELEYYVFRGDGEIVGQLAYLENFNDHGDKIVVRSKTQTDMPATPQKGQRITYRPLRTFANMTEEQVHQAAEKSTTAFGGRQDTPQMMTGNSLPFTDLLVGKEFTVRYDDGPAFNYKVIDTKKLQWKKEGEAEYHDEVYRAYEADEKLVYFSHLHSGSRPRQAVAIAVDLLNGLSTCITSKMGTQYMGNEVSYKASFGVIEMKGIEAPKYVRHCFTDELVGRAFSWSYNDNMTSMHVYTTPHSSSWTIYMDNQALGMNWCAPCIYVKLRDGVYIFCLVEEACNGAETNVIINTKIMHDCGFGFSGGARGVNLGTIGAIARNIGAYDVKRFFGPKVRRDRPQPQAQTQFRPKPQPKA
jgi:hypothetical protein